MKVKLIVARAGADVSSRPGEIIDVPAKEGKALIASGQATPVKRAKPEAAVAPAAPETAAK